MRSFSEITDDEKILFLSIPGVTEDPRFEGLTCKQVAIQVTA